jgi:hypothetical protein
MDAQCMSTSERAVAAKVINDYNRQKAGKPAEDWL